MFAEYDLYSHCSASATTAAGIAKEVKSSLSGVAVVHAGLTKSLEKAKRTIDYVEIKLLEVNFNRVLRFYIRQPFI